MIIKPFSKTFGGVTVLDFPGLMLQPGRIYSIIGANGSGKSTFAKILSGILSADLGGSPLEDSISVGYMPQKNYAFRMSVRSNILLGGKDETRAQALMQALQLSHLSDRRADLLSGGETARMALARLMMQDFPLVILDEPTAAMDMETTLLAEAQIQNYVAKSGCTLFLVTHSLQQARRISDEIIFFHKGSVAEQGPADTVLNTPKSAELKQFLEFYGQ